MLPQCVQWSLVSSSLPPFSTRNTVLGAPYLALVGHSVLGQLKVPSRVPGMLMLRFSFTCQSLILLRVASGATKAMTSISLLVR